MSEKSDIYMKRDMLLGEIHESTKNTEIVMKEIKEWAKEHDKKDDRRFIIGGLAILVLAISAGVLPQILKILGF